MKLQRFNIHTDLEYINNWLTKRNLPIVTRHSLPEMGYMARINGKPVGAIFLRRCEGNVGMVDSLITNPEEEPKVRDFIVECLSKHIIEMAVNIKVTTLIAYSVDENTLTRSLRLGFMKSPQTVVVMDLRNSGV